MNSAGRAVLFAGTTVVIALLGMFALGVSFLNGMAIAASIGVLSVLAASLTLLPALLSFSGARVGATRHAAAPGRGRGRPSGRGGSAPSSGGRWSPQWPPRRSMLALAAPALGLRLGTSDAGNDPAGNHPPGLRPARAGLRQGLQRTAAARRRASGDRPTQRTDALDQRVEHTPGVAAVAPAQLNPDGDVAAFSVYPTSSPQSEQTTALVNRLRDDVIPPVATQTRTTVDIGGATATGVDFSHVLLEQAPALHRHRGRAVGAPAAASSSARC